MAKKTTRVEACANCGFKTEEVRLRGERKLCAVCADSMPGIYCVGGAAEHSVPATSMRQISYCTNLILAELKKMGGRP
jgi:hypothetical protein